jgi:hypothetical protein
MAITNTISAVKAALPELEAGVVADIEAVLAKSESPVAKVISDALPGIVAVAHTAEGSSLFGSFFGLLAAKVPLLATVEAQL